MPRDFRLQVFYMDQFPQSPCLYHEGCFKFFENTRRYSQLKVHHRCRWHRWQIKKIFNQKSFHYFFWTPLSSRVSIDKQVNFKLSAVWYCSHCLPPVSLTPVANLLPVLAIPVAICYWPHWHRWQICCRFCTSGIVGKIFRWCRWYRWQICRRCRWN